MFINCLFSEASYCIDLYFKICFNLAKCCPFVLFFHYSRCPNCREKNRKRKTQRATIFSFCVIRVRMEIRIRGSSKIREASWWLQSDDGKSIVYACLYETVISKYINNAWKSTSKSFLFREIYNWFKRNVFNKQTQESASDKRYHSHTTHVKWVRKDSNVLQLFAFRRINVRNCL